MSWLSRISGNTKEKPDVISGKSPVSLDGLHVVIDRHEYNVSEFALGSFRVRPYDGDLINKQQFDFKISFDMEGDRIEILCHGIVVKNDSQAGLVARYQRPQPFFERKLIEFLSRPKK
jgi:hypothetical protein